MKGLAEDVWSWLKLIIFYSASFVSTLAKYAALE